MRRTAVAAVIAAVALTAAWTFGFWPEHQRRQAAEENLARTEQLLQTAEARLRAAALLGYLLTVEDAVTAHNYGLAREYATHLFDAARQEQDTTSAAVHETIQMMLANRDEVTAALATADPRVGQTLEQLERMLRDSLGYPLPVPP